MIVVGLSPALGTFLAGVVLANSEYRHELESDIGPFKGLLLGLFFITVGAAIQFDLLLTNLGDVLAMTLGLVALKAAVSVRLARIFRIGGADRWLFTLGLAQAGEFGFVLLSFTVANAVIPKPLADQLLLVVTLSMLLTPLLFIVYDKLIAPRFAQTSDPGCGCHRRAGQRGHHRGPRALRRHRQPHLAVRGIQDRGAGLPIGAARDASHVWHQGLLWRRDAPGPAARRGHRGRADDGHRHR